MTEKISALIEGGNASAGPPLGPALGPTPANIGEVVNKINEETKDYKDIEVPVEVEVDEDTGDFEINIGSPPVSALVKKEMYLDKLSSEPGEKIIGDMKIDQAIKIARSVKDNTLARTDKAVVKEVLGSLVSMGIKVDNKDPREVMEEVEEGEYDAKIKGEEELEEVSKEEILEREEELQKKIEEMEAEEEEEEVEEEEEEEEEEEHHAGSEDIEL